MIKFVYLINRIEGMTLDQFIDYHRNQHAPLFTSIPETRRYVKRYTVSHPVAADSYPAAAFDGLTEIWFDSWTDHDAFFASTNYKELVNPDEAKFIESGTIRTMVTEEKVVV